ncbi:BQ2448_1472 [Microbotryum intermedium]|uniref:UDP-N-acetylglucosamine transferase subunit ALG13 n=1 Tax=Microbotryum intermedium TaxID=269621 RepID=A0A238FG04_9BASI|nr:BQ2448_1472 [Microbotryum intermedium]
MPSPSSIHPPPPPAASPPRTCLLTVGSTSFTPLVTTFLSFSTLSTLSTLGIESIVAQIGNSILPSSPLPGTGSSTEKKGWVLGPHRLEFDGREMTVSVLRFSDDLEGRISESDWVVAHAGAGSILSFIRPITTPSTTTTDRENRISKNPNRKLFLTPNSTLMDSHQFDLADEFEQYDWVEVVREPE